MDVMEIAFANARIDARAKAKKYQAKAKGKDKTRKERAKAANIRDALERPSAWLSSHNRHVRFGAYVPNKLDPSRLISILKEQSNER